MDVVTTYRSLTYDLQKFGEWFLHDNSIQDRAENNTKLSPYLQFSTMAAPRIYSPCRAQFPWSTKVTRAPPPWYIAM